MDNNFGLEDSVNVWIRDQSPDWQLGLHMSNVDMLVLTAYKIAGNWKGKIRLCCAVEKSENIRKTEKFFKKFINLARLGKKVEIFVTDKSFSDALNIVEKADLNIFGYNQATKKKNMQKLSDKLGTTCLFVKDSGVESIMA